VFLIMRFMEVCFVSDSRSKLSFSERLRSQTKFGKEDKEMVLKIRINGLSFHMKKIIYISILMVL